MTSWFESHHVTRHDMSPARNALYSLIFVVGCLLIAGAVFGCTPPTQAAVTKVTDGDTIRTTVFAEPVRVLGIDTPEVFGTTECFGAEASAAMKRLLPIGTQVVLHADRETRDRYQRELRYVHRRSDNLDVGAWLLRNGYATVLTIRPNGARAAQYELLEAAARQDNIGLWRAC